MSERQRLGKGLSQPAQVVHLRGGGGGLFSFVKPGGKKKKTGAEVTSSLVCAAGTAVK